VQYNTVLTSLDGLLASLGGSDDAGKLSSGPRGLLLEHLQGARRNFLGSRINEYRASLTDAKESLACIADPGTRIKTRQDLQVLIDAAAA
jgi:hypothetical protein